MAHVHLFVSLLSATSTHKKGIARDLYQYMASFSQTTGQFKDLGDVLVIPTDCIDKWMVKFEDKHRRST